MYLQDKWNAMEAFINRQFHFIRLLNHVFACPEAVGCNENAYCDEQKNTLHSSCCSSNVKNIAWHEVVGFVRVFQLSGVEK